MKEKRRRLSREFELEAASALGTVENAPSSQAGLLARCEVAPSPGCLQAIT